METFPPWLVLPSVYFLIEIIFAITIALPTHWRPATLPLLLYIAYQFQLSVGQFVENRSMAAVPAVNVWIQLLHINDLVVLNPVSYEESVPQPQAKSTVYSPPVARVWKRMKWAFNELYNLRRVGTRLSVKSTPPFSSSDKGYVPSRVNFVLQRLFILCISFLVTDFITSRPRPPNFQTMFAAQKQHVFSRLSEITRKELTIRFFATLAFWIALTGFVHLVHTIPALIMVGTGIDSPRDWPPLMNSFSEAWTVRRLWGTTWHQFLRRSLTANVDFLVSSLAPSGTPRLLRRYTRLLLAFVLSGLLHIAAEHASSVPSNEGGVLRYFTMQALGIMIEDAVLWLAAQLQLRARARGGKTESSGTPVWARVLGYAWVVLWQVWTTPGWNWPFARRARPGVDRMVPFSLFARRV